MEIVFNRPRCREYLEERLPDGSLRLTWADETSMVAVAGPGHEVVCKVAIEGDESGGVAVRITRCAYAPPDATPPSSVTDEQMGPATSPGSVDLAGPAQTGGDVGPRDFAEHAEPARPVDPIDRATKWPSSLQSGSSGSAVNKSSTSPRKPRPGSVKKTRASAKKTRASTGRIHPQGSVVPNALITTPSNRSPAWAERAVAKLDAAVRDVERGLAAWKASPDGFWQIREDEDPTALIGQRLENAYTDRCRVWLAPNLVQWKHRTAGMSPHDRYLCLDGRYDEPDYPEADRNALHKRASRYEIAGRVLARLASVLPGPTVLLAHVLHQDE